MALGLLFGKAFIEAMIGQTIQSLFTTRSSPPTPILVTSAPTPIPKPRSIYPTQPTRPVYVQGTSMVIPMHPLAIRVMNSASYGLEEPIYFYDSKQKRDDD